MTLDEFEQRGREFAGDDVPLGAALRQLADELDRELDDFDDHERNAFSRGWHEAMRAKAPTDAGSEDG